MLTPFEYKKLRQDWNNGVLSPFRADGWHSQIPVFAVPEKGLDLRRVIKGSDCPLKPLRTYRVETL